MCYMDDSTYPKYNLEDIVLYEDKVYKVTSIHALNWFMNNPFVYGIALVTSDPREPLAHKEVYVIEKNIIAASEREAKIWKVLYGKQKADRK